MGGVACDGYHPRDNRALEEGASSERVNGHPADDHIKPAAAGRSRLLSKLLQRAQERSLHDVFSVRTAACDARDNANQLRALLVKMTRQRAS
jgi:hypothetical protein